MPFNLLLFPLVGGYYLIIRLERFKYIQQRLDSQKLLFNSVIAGSFLLILSFLISSLFIYFFPTQAEYLKAIPPLNRPYFATTLLSFFISIVITETGNLFIDRDLAISRSIDKIGNELELLVKLSFETDQLIQFTLKNDKFYIGWAETLPIPQRSNYIRIIPAFSGYRHKETKKLVFTTQYLDIYSAYIREGAVNSIEELNMNLVIKSDDILLANTFNIEMYERFNSLSVEPGK